MSAGPPVRMPAVFFGHGNPMNAIEKNAFSAAWRALGDSLPRPRAILAVSAHWFVPGTFVTAMERPRTIHDFGGFPPELFQVRYPAPGSPDLARRVAALLPPSAGTREDLRWGLDHGTWSVLVHAFPEADVPVVQLSIDETLSAPEHFALARRLAPLRDEGVLVVGSGNVVHNLHAYAWGRHVPEPLPWAKAFDGAVKNAIAADDPSPLVAYETLGTEAHLSAPTPDHFLPLLYVLAVREPGEGASFPVEGYDGGSISMLAVRVGD